MNTKPLVKTKRITLRLSAAQRKRLEELVVEHETNITDLIIEALKLNS